MKNELGIEIIAYCCYCHGEILEGEGCMYIPDKGWVHYDPNNRLKNCYFPEEENE